MFTLNLSLITIVNPSLLNPGPKLSIFYQIVQGFIPVSYLKHEHPILNDTKVLELNSYLNELEPDIVLLNETWLKKSISNGEVIYCNNYKTFRYDRCTASHPPYPSNIGKFKRNGGGVMIAVKNYLDRDL